MRQSEVPTLKEIIFSEHPEVFVPSILLLYFLTICSCILMCPKNPLVTFFRSLTGRQSVLF